MRYREFQLAAIARHIVQHGGCSVVVESDRTTHAPQDGYMVSLPYHEVRLAIQPDEPINPMKLVPWLDAFLQANRRELAVPGTYLGAWFDGDHLYLDVSMWVADRESAERTARGFSQLAIFDLAGAQTIRVG